MPRLGVIGVLVWDEIHGRDPAAPPLEEWGGIAYSLGALDAALPAGWEIVPLVKVGRDMRPQAAEFFRGLRRLMPGARPIEVDAPNNRVVLRYHTAERRCEQLTGGVPPWTWPELGPLVQDLDALYVNFISGFELTLETAVALRRAFRGPTYADLHSLFLGIRADGHRVPQALRDASGWFGSFDVIQLNEQELHQLASEPLPIAASALAAGAEALIVTLGSGGAVYFEADRGRGPGVLAQAGAVLRTARVPAPLVDAVDPTGCGDVFGATCCARLLAGDPLERAVAAANQAAARNATFRGAAGLAKFLRGELLGSTCA